MLKVRTRYNMVQTNNWYKDKKMTAKYNSYETVLIYVFPLLPIRDHHHNHDDNFMLFPMLKVRTIYQHSQSADFPGKMLSAG